LPPQCISQIGIGGWWIQGLSPRDVDIRILRDQWQFLGLRNSYTLSSTSGAKRQVIPRKDGSIVQIGIDMDKTGNSLN
jgi:hypothetical protein